MIDSSSESEIEGETTVGLMLDSPSESYTMAVVAVGDTAVGTVRTSSSTVVLEASSSTCDVVSTSSSLVFSQEEKERRRGWKMGVSLISSESSLSRRWIITLRHGDGRVPFLMLLEDGIVVGGVDAAMSEAACKAERRDDLLEESPSSCSSFLFLLMNKFEGGVIL